MSSYCGLQHSAAARADGYCPPHLVQAGISSAVIVVSRFGTAQLPFTFTCDGDGFAPVSFAFECAEDHGDSMVCAGIHGPCLPLGGGGLAVVGEHVCDGFEAFAVQVAVMPAVAEGAPVYEGVDLCACWA